MKWNKKVGHKSLFTLDILQMDFAHTDTQHNMAMLKVYCLFYTKVIYKEQFRFYLHYNSYICCRCVMFFPLLTAVYVPTRKVFANILNCTILHMDRERQYLPCILHTLNAHRVLLLYKNNISRINLTKIFVKFFRNTDLQMILYQGQNQNNLNSYRHNCNK